MILDFVFSHIFSWWRMAFLLTFFHWIRRAKVQAWVQVQVLAKVAWDLCPEARRNQGPVVNFVKHFSCHVENRIHGSYVFIYGYCVYYTLHTVYLRYKNPSSLDGRLEVISSEGIMKICKECWKKDDKPADLDMSLDGVCRMPGPGMGKGMGPPMGMGPGTEECISFSLG